MRFPSLAWPSLSRRSLALMVLVIALLGAGAGGAWWWLGRLGLVADEAYADALGLALEARARGAASGEVLTHLEETLARQPGHRQAAQLALLLGDLHVGARQFAKARAAYAVTAVRDPGGILGRLAAGRIAWVWEVEQDPAQALKLLGSTEGDTPAALQAARLLERLGRRDEAARIYARIAEDKTDSSARPEVRQRIGALTPASQPSAGR